MQLSNMFDDYVYICTVSRRWDEYDDAQIKYELHILQISVIISYNIYTAGCMATVAMCVTIYTNRIYMVEIFPMLLSVAIISFGEIIENNAIMPINFINPSYSYPRLVYYFITVGIIMLFTYINVRVFRNGKYDK